MNEKAAVEAGLYRESMIYGVYLGESWVWYV